MTVEPGDALWLVDGDEVSFARLAEFSGLSVADLRELVECGAIAPVDRSAAEWTFQAGCIVSVRTAGRLRDELELDTHALALTLRLIGRIGELEAQLRELRAQLPRTR